jgi:hypothetical protein
VRNDLFVDVAPPVRRTPVQPKTAAEAEASMKSLYDRWQYDDAVQALENLRRMADVNDYVDRARKALDEANLLLSSAVATLQVERNSERQIADSTALLEWIDQLADIFGEGAFMEQGRKLVAELVDAVVSENVSEIDNALTELIDEDRSVDTLLNDVGYNLTEAEQPEGQIDSTIDFLERFIHCVD